MASLDLETALKMFKEGMTKSAVTDTLIKANDFASELRRSNIDEAQKREGLRHTADQLTLALSNQGLSPAEILQAGTSIAPFREVEDKMKLQTNEANLSFRNAAKLAALKGEGGPSRETLVPGFGHATQAGIAKDLIALNSDRMKGNAAINEIMEITKAGNAKYSLEQQAKLRVLLTSVRSAMREEIVGTGTLTDPERELIKQVVADPSDFFTLQNSLLTTFNKIKEAGARNMDSKLQAAGIDTSSPEIQKNLFGNNARSAVTASGSSISKYFSGK